MHTSKPQVPQTHERTSAPLRVLHIIESLGRAGAEQTLVNLLRCFKKNEITSEVVALWPPYDLADDLRSYQVPVHELGLASRWAVQGGIAKLRRLIRYGAFDLVHAHLPMSVFYAAMSRGHVPLVATFHGLSFDLYPANTLARKVRRQAETWWTNHRVAGFTAVSTSVAQHYHDTLKIPLDRIQVIPNGFPVDEIKPDPALDAAAVRRRYGVGANDFFIVHAGRFVPHKGHAYLLQALSILRDEGFRFQVVLIGGGPTEASIREVIQDNNLSGLVQLRPPVSQSDLKQVMQAADLFVFPSISEGFGMAAGEAMCLEVPVVASDLAGIASLIKDGVSGLLVPPANPPALAVAIKRVFSDRALSLRVAKGGRERIRTFFACEAIADRMVNLYHRTVREET